MSSTSTPNENTDESKQEKSNFKRFWDKYSSQDPQYERWTRKWYLEMLYLCVMFSATGSLALFVVRNIMSLLSVDASLFRGEWYHRLLYFCIMFPTYSVSTYLVGTLFGRHVYAKRLIIKMWSRWGKVGQLVLNVLRIKP